MNGKNAIPNYLKMCLHNLAMGYRPWEEAKSAGTYARQQLTPAVAKATQHCAWFIYETVCKYNINKVIEILKG